MSLCCLTICKKRRLRENTHANWSRIARQDRDRAKRQSRKTKTHKNEMKTKKKTKEKKEKKRIFMSSWLSALSCRLCASRSSSFANQFQPLRSLSLAKWNTKFQLKKCFFLSFFSLYYFECNSIKFFFFSFFNIFHYYSIADALLVGAKFSRIFRFISLCVLHRHHFYSICLLSI